MFQQVPGYVLIKHSQYKGGEMQERLIINIIDNLESDSVTDALSARQGKVLKELIQEKNIMTAKLNEDIPSTQGSQYINMELISSSVIGDKLTINNGGIKIGSGVSKVKVNSNLKIVCRTTGNKHMRILKNGSTVAWVNSRALSTDDEFTISISPVIIDVQENDVIYLAYYAGIGDGISSNYNSTYLTVEVVG